MSQCGWDERLQGQVCNSVVEYLPKIFRYLSYGFDPSIRQEKGNRNNVIKCLVSMKCCILCWRTTAVQ